MRVLLLLTAQTYRAPAFIAAAERLGIDAVQAIDMPEQLTDYWNYALGINYSDRAAAIRSIVEFAAKHPLDAILAVDDSGSILATHASAALDLPHNAVAAAEAARNKHRMRELLQQGGVPVPTFRLCSTTDDLGSLAAQITYPCVVKPLDLNGSRGVIRADAPAQFVAAAQRLAVLLTSIDPTPGPKPFLIERFIPGCEVALEGLLDHGRLHVLALFDKPDPLDGPFFEETIYVTPSRLPIDVQEAIASCTAAAAAAIGLRAGPIHAELRINEHGPWIVEIAGRSIGGLCAKTLRFGANVSLEELILRQACGLPIDSFGREQQARGVMMIPIPGEGVLRNVTGLEEALAVPGIEEIDLTAKLNYPLVPLPEGDSYLGFIFARGETPEEAERALRRAYQRLHFTVLPSIPLSLKQ
ncbi:MAG: ATP-grasp domain-containing protein [Chloroflexales bacterium]|nr:ATP-grasp domain-containing protein [Chloroflexales bacterium]